MFCSSSLPYVDEYLIRGKQDSCCQCRNWPLGRFSAGSPPRNSSKNDPPLAFEKSRSSHDPPILFPLNYTDRKIKLKNSRRRRLKFHRWKISNFFLYDPPPIRKCHHCHGKLVYPKFNSFSPIFNKIWFTRYIQWETNTMKYLSRDLLTIDPREREREKEVHEVLNTRGNLLAFNEG